jgi:hypothetical protein
MKVAVLERERVCCEQTPNNDLVKTFQVNLNILHDTCKMQLERSRLLACFVLFLHDLESELATVMHSVPPPAPHIVQGPAYQNLGASKGGLDHEDGIRFF